MEVSKQTIVLKTNPEKNMLEQSDLLWTGIAGLGNASSSLARWQLRARVTYSAKARRAVIQDVI